MLERIAKRLERIGGRAEGAEGRTAVLSMTTNVGKPENHRADEGAHQMSSLIKQISKIKETLECPIYVKVNDK
jgi:hypothetical protein